MIREQCNSCQYDLNCSNQSRVGNKYDNTVCEDYEGPINNSDGMFKRVFTYKGRIRRLEFGISYLIYCILYFFVITVIRFVSQPMAMSLMLAYLVIVVGMYLQMIKRCHDVGKSGWWVLVPIFNPFFLLFEKGEDNVNEYGTNPKESYQSQSYPVS